MKIYRRVFRFLGFDPETIEKCLQKSRQEVLYSTKKSQKEESMRIHRRWSYCLNRISRMSTVCGH